MKNLILCSTLALFACAASAKTLRDNGGSIAGESKGVQVKGETRTPTEIQPAGSEPRFTFWGSELTPISPEEVGRPTPAVTRDRLEKEPAWDFQSNAP